LLRVVSTDVNGTSRVSNSVRVSITPQPCAVGFLPAQPALVLRCQPQDMAPATVRLYNGLGQQVFAATLGPQFAGSQLPLPAIARGTYLLTATYPDGSQTSQKVVY
jgi:hypothetical protein